MAEALKQEQTLMPNLWFRLMALEYRTRSNLPFTTEKLRQAGFSRGMRVVDFGCGPGRCTFPTASIVGEEGVVYAVDAHPLAIQMVEKAARKAGLTNIKTIRSSCTTGLEPETIDVALLFDTLHDVDDKEAVLGELHRVLRPKGRLLYKDHTLNGEHLIELMRSSDFRVASKSEILSFVKF